jgi:hypothetical protein
MTLWFDFIAPRYKAWRVQNNDPLCHPTAQKWCCREECGQGWYDPVNPARMLLANDGNLVIYSGLGLTLTVVWDLFSNLPYGDCHDIRY